MGIEDINIFHERLEKSLMPYLKSCGFDFDNKKIDESIGSYFVKFKRKDKCISLSFCMHHYDLFDGIKVNLYYESNFDNMLTLNTMGVDKYKIYSQLKPENAMTEIVSDLKNNCVDFLDND